MLLTQQQELSEKIEAQQATMTHMTNGARMPKMAMDNHVHHSWNPSKEVLCQLAWRSPDG